MKLAPIRTPPREPDTVTHSTALDPFIFALSLFAMFAVAKLVVVANRDLPHRVGTGFALLGQDALFAILTGMALGLLARRSLFSSCVIYGLLCAYAAVNVPLTLALSSPLTLQIWQAAGGPLTDSI